MGTYLEKLEKVLNSVDKGTMVLVTYTHMDSLDSSYLKMSGGDWRYMIPDYTVVLSSRTLAGKIKNHVMLGGIWAMI